MTPLNARGSARRYAARVRTSGRATRFDVPVPLRYRLAGTAAWSEGRIENISRSGLLFRVERPLPVDTAVEMTFALPVPAGRDLLCRGRVVRTVSGTDAAGRPGIAATIATFRFLPGTSKFVREVVARAESR